MSHYISMELVARLEHFALIEPPLADILTGR